MVEFALILPFFLILLIGVIEAGRIIWAYITVQTAAREAARYAVTGKPYLEPININNKITECERPEGEENVPGVDSLEPWLCEPENRREAIKEVALARGRTLNVSDVCDTLAEFDSTSACARTGGAFGVRVIGQIISPTVSLTAPVIQLDHPGTQGLNVSVETFYNVQTLFPLFDVFMGGDFLTLRGAIEMQNEGVEAALGVAPPPAINVAGSITNSGTTPVGPNGEIIEAENYNVFQNESLYVRLLSHPQPAGPYDVYLENITGTGLPIRICVGIATDFNNQARVSCYLDASNVPPGEYTLFSTYAGQQSQLTSAPQQVKVNASNVPAIVINNGNVWAVNSTIAVNLVSHNVDHQPFVVYFDYGGPDEELLTPTPVTASPGPISWTVPDVGNRCPQFSATPCKIQSFRAGDLSTVYAEANIYINQPEIVLAGGNMVYAEGEAMYIFLRGHTPNTEYDVKIEGPGGTLVLGRAETGRFGNTASEQEIRWAVPVGWPEGFYTLSSHPAVGEYPPDSSTLTWANEIGVLENVEISTPTNPYITIDGGYVWPIDSLINIQVHRHPASAVHYLYFGPWRVPTAAADDTFTTNTTGGAVIGYRIPITATETVQTSFLVESHLNSDDTLIATRNVTVYPVPIIMVLEGDTVLPDSTITIRVANHSPNTPYIIRYADEEIFSVLTDVNGGAEFTFDLSLLSAANPARANYGTPFPLNSWQTVGGDEMLAETNLTLQPADLRITSIVVPANVPVNTSFPVTVPVTVTVENVNPVTLSRYFDVDFYGYSPSDRAENRPVPTYQAGRIGFPGDYKDWISYIGAGQQVAVNGYVLVYETGTYTSFGFADTSNFVLPETSETNNISSTTFRATCAIGSCPPVDPADILPPGYRECNSLLHETGFEEGPPFDYWHIAYDQHVAQVGSPKHTGLHGLFAPTYDSSHFNPYFYQPFTMPDWVISSTTTLEVDLWKRIDKPGGADADPHDIFYVVVLSAPNLGATMITSPTEVARGSEPNSWLQKTAILPVATGINLEDYAGQPLYVYFYNNTNALAGCPPSSPTCGESYFYFDDVDLEICTTVPLPANITTRITGNVRVLEAGNRFASYENDRVWAYSQGGDMVETVTIRNGEFNFYNLPADPGGTRYYIYAEHAFTGSGGRVQVVANHTTVILTPNNNYASPVQTTILLRDPLP
jgi:hypothetical protein